MPERRHGLNFLVTLLEPGVIDDVAPEVSAALGVTLEPSGDVPDAFVAEIAGLRVWLQFANPDEPPPRTMTLLGAPEPPLEPDVDWLDGGPYIAELLSERTHRRWAPGAPAA